MKRVKILFVGLMLLTSANFVSAQASYKYGIGAVVGTMDGVSFKMFLSDNLALKADLAYKYTIASTNVYDTSVSGGQGTFELNPNILYQRNITDFGWGGLDWYAGGGLGLGMAFGGYGTTLGKFGLNAIGGVELPLSNIPLALDFDFRPGYGLIFGQGGSMSYFDWAITLGVRYCW